MLTSSNTSPSQIGPGRGEYPVPKRETISHCISCHAPIIWGRTSKNGRPIPLSVATIRTDTSGQRWATTHFADCPSAAQHRKQAGPERVRVDLRELHDYLEEHHLVVIGSTITDDGNCHLLVELQTRTSP
jgi:hypothetical protein